MNNQNNENGTINKYSSTERKDLHPRAITLLSLAYLYFDPHPDIYRGIVVAKAGYDAKLRRSQRTGIEVLNPDGTVISGLLWPDYETVPSSTDKRSGRSILQRISDLYEEGDTVLVRRRGSFAGRSGPLPLFGPLISVNSEDNATLNGARIETKIGDKQILHLPIVERIRGRDISYGIGYVNSGVGTYLVPALIDRADDKVGSILPEVNILSNRRNFIVGEMPIPATEKHDDS